MPGRVAMYFLHCIALIYLLIAYSQGKPIILRQPFGWKMCEKLSRTVRFPYPVKFHMNDMTCEIDAAADDDDTKGLSSKPIVFKHANFSNSRNASRRPLVIIDTRRKGKQRVPYGQKTMESNQLPPPPPPTTTIISPTPDSNTSLPLKPYSLISKQARSKEGIHTFGANCTKLTEKNHIEVKYRWGVNYNAVGNGEIGAKCTEDTDCRFGDSVRCYVGRCQCKPSLNFSPTMGQCTFRCRKYGNTYSKYEGLKTDGQANTCLRMESVASADLCWNNFIVFTTIGRSAVYQNTEAKNEKGVCILNLGIVADSVRKSESKELMYLKRDCK